MTLTDLVAPNAILPALKVNGKKQVLHELAARAAMLTGQNERAIFDILMQREKLGSTAVGNGIIALMLAVLMSVTQIGSQAAVAYSQDVAAVFEAALTAPNVPG